MADLGLRGSYRFRVRAYECGPDGLATLPAVLDYFQEAAGRHADELGFSRDDFAGAGREWTWVLARLVARMERYPACGDEVTVVTFPRGGSRVVAWRDFELLAADGARLGAGSSEWVVIDIATRRIQSVPERVLASDDPANAPTLGPRPFTRFRFPEGAAGPAPLDLVARRSELDLNGHVNNVRYVEWLLEPCAGSRPRELEIAFRAETFAGDAVRVETAAEEGATYHRVRTPGGAERILARTAW